MRYGHGAMNDKNMAQIIGEVERSTRLRIYSKKYAIISYLYENDGASCSTILANCPFSNSTFFSSLNELKRSGIVKAGSSASCISPRPYRLSNEVRHVIGSAHLSIERWMRSRLSKDCSEKIGPIDIYVSLIEQNLNIRYYSIEFDIVIHLYEVFKARAIDIFNSGKHSNTSFYYTLRRLAEMGILTCKADASDHRSKVYGLSAQVRTVLDSAHERIVELRLLVN